MNGPAFTFCGPQTRMNDAVVTVYLVAVAVAVVAEVIVVLAVVPVVPTALFRRSVMVEDGGGVSMFPDVHVEAERQQLVEVVDVHEPIVVTVTWKIDLWRTHRKPAEGHQGEQ